MQMNSTQESGDDQTAGDDSMQGDDGSDEGQNGYTLCIMVSADNRISVSMEQGTDPDQDGDDDSSEEGDTDDDSNTVQVKSLNDLVALVKRVIRSGGQLDDGGQSDFAAGAGE